MCPNLLIDEHERLAHVLDLVQNANRNPNSEPVDLYRLHAYFTPTDEVEDDVADANENVGLAFGYGPVDLGEYEFADEEMWAYYGEEDLESDGSELLWVRDYESEVGSEDEYEDGSEGEGEEEQQVGGDIDGDRMRTNTDPTTTTAAAGEEQDLNTNSEHTNPDTPAAPASSNTNMQRADRPIANNDTSAGEPQAQND